MRMPWLRRTRGPERILVPAPEYFLVRRRGAKRAWALFFAVFLPAFALYLWTLAPTVSAEDSGELITAAYTLGIAHPPGYPLWCLLGKAFSFIPVGSVAWRVNLLSAVLGASSAGFVALIAYRFAPSYIAAAAGGLLFAASRDFWGQAVVAEVYTLNVLLVLLVLLFTLRYEERYLTRELYWAAFTIGLGMTNHSTMGPLAVLFVLWVALRHLYLFRSPRLVLNLALAFLMGLSILIYLPVRSAADPVMDWGNPETLAALEDHVLRRSYTESAEPRERTIGGQATLVWDFAKTYAAQFTGPIGALALLGGFVQYRRRRAAFVLLAALFGMTSYGFIWLLDYAPDRENLHLTRVFFLPAHAVAAIWIAVALHFLIVRARRRWEASLQSRSGRALTALATAVLLLAPTLSHFSLNDRSGDFLAEDWGRSLLTSVEPGAILITGADHSTFPLIYLQAVEGLRPDVFLASKYGYIEERLFRALFEGRDPPSYPPPLEGSEREKYAYLVRHSKRPVYFATKADDPMLSTHELRPRGLLYLATPVHAEATREEDEDALWADLHFRPDSLERPSREFGNDLILIDYHFARARRELARENKDAALAGIERALDYAWGLKAATNNLGGFLAESGFHREAIPLLTEALRIDPAYELAALNLAGVFHELGDYERGFEVIRRASHLRPERRPLRLAKARACAATGRVELARTIYESLVERSPYDAELRAEAKEFLRSKVGKEAVAEFEKVEKKITERIEAKAKEMEGPPAPEAPDSALPKPLAAR